MLGDICDALSQEALRNRSIYVVGEVAQYDSSGWFQVALSSNYYYANSRYWDIRGLLWISQPRLLIGRDATILYRWEDWSWGEGERYPRVALYGQRQLPLTILEEQQLIKSDDPIKTFLEFPC